METETREDLMAGERKKLSDSSGETKKKIPARPADCSKQL